MASIVDSLFGPAPWELQQQQQRQTMADAAGYARMQPLERAAMGMYQAGSGFGGMLGNAMGMENPAIAAAKQREAVMAEGGIDLSPQGLLLKAEKFRQIGDIRTAMMLYKRAQEAQTAQADAQFKQARAMAEMKKAQSEGSPFGKINPKDFTPASIAKFSVSRDWGDLEPTTADGKMSQMALKLTEAGIEPGTPEFVQTMRRAIEAEIIGKGKGAGTNITNVMPGSKELKDLPKFRKDVLDLVKPERDTIFAADKSLGALKESIATGNFAAFRGARDQLAKAFGDSQISRQEIENAGVDPSIVGGLIDKTSTLFTGTPSRDTQIQMVKALKLLREVAAKRIDKEIARNKAIGLESGYAPAAMDLAFDVDEIYKGAKNAGSGSKRTIKLKSGAVVTVED